MWGRRNLLVAFVIGGHLHPNLNLALTCQADSGELCVPALRVSYEAVDTYVPVPTGATVAHAFGKQKSLVFQRVPAGMFLRIPTYN